eukprot:m.115195 g.115195  ORF g.115195 m.115195 type:complete len:140 (+) comp37538_c0_seq3:1038-1457(+)
MMEPLPSTSHGSLFRKNHTLTQASTEESNAFTFTPKAVYPSLTLLFPFFMTISVLGVILPNDCLDFPFTFKSAIAGIFTETWQFETRPVLCRGAPLLVTLRGVALREDKLKKTRAAISVRGAPSQVRTPQLLRHFLRLI